jgi:hypothetical protein
MKKVLTPSLLLWLALSLVACTAAPEATQAPPPPEPTEVPPTQAPTEPLPQPTNTPLPPTETPIPPTEVPAGPPPDPQVIEFTTEDGVTLKGTYFPAAVEPAPIIVLMHQVNFDERQWKAIAPWMQNRGVTWDAYARGSMLASVRIQTLDPWFDSSWFPPMPEDPKVALFTYTARGCEGPEGCGDYMGMKWATDAAAALKTASQLPEIDPDRVATIGTSIGGNGAVDGCMLYMAETGRKCAFALAVSPGISYLDLVFVGTVKKLVDAGVMTYCYAARNDQHSFDACNSFTEQTDLYEKIIEEHDYHGIYAARPDAKPNLLETILYVTPRIILGEVE